MNDDNKEPILDETIEQEEVVTPKKRSKRNKIKFRHRHPILFYFFWITVVTSILGVSGVAWYVENTLEKTPRITEQMLKSDGTSNMYDANGNVIWSSTEIRRDYVKADNISDLYKKMLLATEDATFETDGGFSKKGVVNMVTSTLLSKFTGKGQGRGGSSIEQQLIKMTAFDTSKETNQVSTIRRKIQELWLAQQLDANFSKKQILEFYVNKMFLGEGSYGAETISRTYFNKSLMDLNEKTPENISKTAILAGLGQAPASYNLYDNPALVEKRRNQVLYASLKNNVITEAQYKAAKAVPVADGLQERYWRNQQVLEQTGKYNAYISGTLQQLSSLGYDLSKTPLQIHTYLQPEQQDWLTNTVKNQQYQDGLQEVAVTVMDATNSHVIAISGGRNEVANGLNRALQTTRSSGSSMKPFIGYGPAIEYFGYGSNSMWDSSPYRYPGTNAVATNYGGYTYGTVTMQYALAMSLNTPVNRILDGVVGSAYAKQFLSQVGLDVKESYGGSDALGLNVSTEMEAAAYAALAQNGKYTSPQYISKLVFSDGSEKEIKPEAAQAMKESTAYVLNSMLKTTTNKNMSAQKAAIPEFAGMITKTGTTNYDPALGFTGDVAPDSWISGSTKSIAVSIWTGYDSPNEYGHWINVNESMKYGLYVDVMKHYNQGKDTSDWAMPSTVTNVGNGLYKPNDTNTSTITNPAGIDIIDMSQVLDFAKVKLKNPTVGQEKTESGVPNDYKIGDWAKNLNDEQKSVYSYYTTNKGTLPTLKDILDDKTYSNTSN